MLKPMSLIAVLSLALAACSSAPTHPAVTGAPVDVSETSYRNPASDTDIDVMNEITKPKVTLEKCGGRDGYAKMIRSGGQLVIQIRNIECGSYKTKYMSEEAKLNGTGNGDRWIDITVNEDDAGWHEMTVGSAKYFNNPEAGSKGDIIRFYVPAKTVVLDLYWSQETRPFVLRNCKGTVQGNLKNGQVSLVFRDVTRCNKFDILKNDNSSLSYDAKDLQAQGDSLGGSFSIPKRFVDFGSNGVIVKVYRKGGGEDRILVRFNGSN